MNLTALETMQIFARCIIHTFLYPEQRESQVAITGHGTVTKCLLFAIIFSPLGAGGGGNLGLCVRGWGLASRNKEVVDDRKEFLVYPLLRTELLRVTWLHYEDANCLLDDLSRM